ncbi:caspase family protein [Caulobacter sp. KR2-114]|uniref:caspase family protein n=1 Tax=Caulobacter sp. KR2-114 TaxID=3400912 RepID=UPI003BFCEAAE
MGPGPWLAAALALLLAPSPAFADRLALVIGNGGYAHAGELLNPTRDAAAVAARLDRLGFDVLEKEDIDNNHLREAIVAFKHKVHDGDLVVIYYAGHGMEVNGSDYMIPVDADIRAEGDVADLGYDISKLFFEDMKHISLIFMFDACRDNVFQENIGSKRAGTNPAAAPGRVIILAAGPGQQSYDAAPGSTGDPNSVFATAVLHALDVPLSDQNSFVQNITREVATRTGSRQVPSVSGMLLENIFFNGGSAAPPPTLAASAARPAPAASGAGEDPPVPQPPPPVEVAVADTHAAQTRKPEVTPDISELLRNDGPSQAFAAPPSPAPSPPPAPPAAQPPSTPATPVAAPVAPSAAAAPRTEIQAMLSTIPRAAQARAGGFTIAALGFGALPPRPVLTPPPGVDIPASFCSLEARNQFHDRVYVPARTVAYDNNERAAQYIKDLDTLRREYESQVNGFYVVVVKESQDYKATADEQFAASEKYRKMFDAIMDTPVTPCK